MLKRTLLTALAAAGTLAFAASAHAAYLSVGTTNTYTAGTTLTGTVATPALTVRNGNGSSTGTYALYGLLTPTSPTVTESAIRGHNSSTNALGVGVFGSQAGSGKGVVGYAPSGTGVYGTSSTGNGVYGTGSNGVYALSPTSNGNGVLGQANTGGAAYGVWGTSSTGYGVVGEALGSSAGPGVWGYTSSTTAQGVVGQHGAGTGTTAGAEGDTFSTSGNANGVQGVVESASPGGFSAGVRGVNNGTGGLGIGVWGSQAGSGWGGYFTSSTGVGVLASGSPAGDFSGDVDVSGNLNVTGTKNFRIDDPRAPAKRFLVHAAIESNQVLNVYSGNVTTNGRGLAKVKLPSYFQAINTDYRYQLTVVGRSFARAIVWAPVAHNRFTIRTDRPNVKVSWQVTAKRSDPYMRAHPFKAVVPKTGHELGRYLTPELYGKPKSDGIYYQKQPRVSKTSGLSKTPRLPKQLPLLHAIHKR